MKKISIKDIARQAGVVPSTVSFVLNGKAKERRISDGLAEKIRAIAEETGYQPSHTAVSLRTGKSKILGLVIEDISNVFFASLAKTIEEEAYALGYKVVYCSTENNDEKGRELIRMLSLQGVDGFLITPTSGLEKEVSNLLEQNRPVVLIDRYFPGQEITHVLVDNYKGVEEGMQHLIGKGYKKIGFVTVDLEQVQMREREAAYHETMRAAGLDSSSLLKLSYSLKQEEAVEQISAFLGGNRSIEAVFFATNYLGVYGLESIRNLDLTIPDHLAVVCFDDHDIFRLHKPAITIIRQPVREIGITAVRLLMMQFESVRSLQDGNQILKKPELVIRAST